MIRFTVRLSVGYAMLSIVLILAIHIIAQQSAANRTLGIYTTAIDRDDAPVTYRDLRTAVDVTTYITSPDTIRSEDTQHDFQIFRGRDPATTLNVAVPVNYQPHPTDNGSPDGTRLVVTNQIDQYVVELAIYSLLDDSITPILLHRQVENGFQTPAIPRVQWSPDSDLLLVTPAYMDRIVEYRVYDATSGKKLRDYQALLTSRGSTRVFWLTR